MGSLNQEDGEKHVHEWIYPGCLAYFLSLSWKMKKPLIRADYRFAKKVSGFSGILKLSDITPETLFSSLNSAGWKGYSSDPCGEVGVESLREPN